jgi:hypothetical protein
MLEALSFSDGPVASPRLAEFPNLPDLTLLSHICQLLSEFESGPVLSATVDLTRAPPTHLAAELEGLNPSVAKNDVQKGIYGPFNPDPPLWSPDFRVRPAVEAGDPQSRIIRDPSRMIAISFSLGHRLSQSSRLSESTAHHRLFSADEPCSIPLVRSRNPLGLDSLIGSLS